MVRTNDVFDGSSSFCFAKRVLFVFATVKIFRLYLILRYRREAIEVNLLRFFSL